MPFACGMSFKKFPWYGGAAKRQISPMSWLLGCGLLRANTKQSRVDK